MGIGIGIVKMQLKKREEKEYAGLEVMPGLAFYDLENKSLKGKHRLE